MQPIRILFDGDPAAATPWVGLAKKLARQTFKARIRNKTVQVADGVRIRVENVIPQSEGFGRGVQQTFGGLSKVWIESKKQEAVYQFICTGYPIQYKTISGFATAQGSAVAAKLPQIKNNTAVDWDKIKVIATGSTLVDLPNGKVKETDIQKIQYVNNLIQIQLVPEPVNYSFDDLTKPVYSKVVYSWSGQSGDIYCAGWFMLSNQQQISDLGYDMPPTVVKNRRPIPRMPDSDWPDSSCRVLVKSQEYGDRHFIVMVDARSRFYCWPDQYSSDEYIYPPDSPYISQAIKTNVADYQTKFSDPPFPDWVHTFPVGYTRRDNDFTSKSGEPRYVWRFHPLGNKVVGIVIKRDRLSSSVFSNSYTPGIPLKEGNIGELKINVSWRGNGETDWDDIMVDTYGLVELSLNIEITGINKEDFSFSTAILRNIEAGIQDYPIAADYLSPIFIDGGWTSRGISASPGDLMVAYLDIYTDQLSVDDVNNSMGYLNAVDLGTRQTWVTIKSIDSNTTVMKFICDDLPSLYKYKIGDIRETTLQYQYAEFRQLDLSKLNISYYAAIDKFDFDIEPYATTTGDDSVDINVSQRWLSTESGIRIFILGKKEVERSYGGNLGLWDTVDATSLGNDLIRVNISTIGTRWFAKPYYTAWNNVSFLANVVYRYENMDDKTGTYEERIDRLLNDYYGGHSGLQESFADYVPAIWNDYIKPKLQVIIEDMTTMRDLLDAGDLSSNIGPSHAYSRHYSTLINQNDYSLKTAYDYRIMPKSYNYPIGAEWYNIVLGNIFISRATFDVISDIKGFYAVNTDVVYMDGRIPNFSFFTGKNSSLPATRYGEEQYPQYTPNDAIFSEVNKPAKTVFKRDIIDIVAHINGGETSHKSLYNIAYMDNIDYPELDNFVTVADNKYIYSYRTKYMLDGQQKYDTLYIFDRSLSVFISKFNGAGYFL